MRFVDVRERAVPISRYSDPSIPSGGLDTSAVALTTDVVRDGTPVVGYGFGSIGRFAQSGLIRERFAPRLLRASDAELAGADGTNVDPFRAWALMMKGEKPGGHGERCVAVGALDMAVWDAAAKIAGVPLHRFLAETVQSEHATPRVRAYASGGYLYPAGDEARLRDEARALLAGGYTHLKIKIGAAPLAQDCARIESVLALLPSGERLAVDAMNQYDPARSLEAARALAPYGLWWFEDVCDPLDFETQAAVVRAYDGPVAVGEALFSDAEAKLIDAFGGLRRERDILQFDPAHCYGVPGYLRIVDAMLARGWPRSAFWPHGGHLYTLHLVAALGLGGCEMNPRSFQPFGGLGDGVTPNDGWVAPPDAPGIGFETKPALVRLFREL
ncbi:MAG TPA: enolase C-terminal domain-like protein [Candidatus Elarobacter sp.]|jgi:L-alanine-DL-glutamate epimerase-like enolase superfamily enzyme